MSSTVSAVAAAGSASSSSSSSHTGPRGTATEDEEDAADEMMAAINKLLTQPTNAEEWQISRTLKTYIAKQGGPRAFLQRSVVEEEEEEEEGPYHSSNSESDTANNDNKIGRNGPVGGGSVLLEAPVQLPPIPQFTYNDNNTRVLLTEDGFDPEDLNKRNEDGWTPMTYFSYKGNVTMVRYLVAHGADSRKAEDEFGIFPLYLAAAYGHLDIVKLLSRDGGAHDDIRRVVTKYGYSPLRIALKYDQVDVWKWLIPNGALAPRNDVDGGGIDDATMRRDLRQDHTPGKWGSDHRLTVLAWARDAVIGMIVRSNQNTSPLAIFNGQSGILALIAQYMTETTPQQAHMLRQLMVLLPAFIKDTPFVPRNDEDEDEENY